MRVRSPGRLAERVQYRVALGARLRDVRLARGITQTFAAKVIGCSRGNLSLIEQGLQFASVDDLRMLGELYHCSLAELATVDAPLPPGPPIRNEKAA